MLHKVALSEIEDYFKKFRAETVLGRTDARSIYLTAYKHVHALLIFNHAIASRKKRPLKANDPALYLQESVSDLVQSQAMFLLGLYKAGRGSLRSAIENFLRSVCLLQKGQIDNLKSTYDLIAEARKLTLNQNSEVIGFLNAIVLVYNDLCKYVHSSTPQHMIFAENFGKLFSYRPRTFESCCEQTKTVCSNANKIIYWMKEDALRKVGHKNSDYVLDSLPRSLKRAATNRTS